MPQKINRMHTCCPGSHVVSGLNRAFRGPVTNDAVSKWIKADSQALRTVVAGEQFVLFSSEMDLGSLTDSQAVKPVRVLEFVLSRISCSSCIAAINQNVNENVTGIAAARAERVPSDRLVVFLQEEHDAQTVHDKVVALVETLQKGATLLKITPCEAEESDPTTPVIPSHCEKEFGLACPSFNSLTATKSAKKKVESPCSTNSACHVQATAGTNTAGQTDCRREAASVTQKISSHNIAPAHQPKPLKNQVVLQYIVHGMTCASCSSKIEKSLLKNSWITDAVVNVTTSSAAVTVTDLRMTSAQSIASKITALGFPAELIGGAESQSAFTPQEQLQEKKYEQHQQLTALKRSHEINELRRSVIFSSTFTALIMLLMFFEMSKQGMFLNTVIKNGLRCSALINGVLATPVVWLCGGPFFRRAYVSLKQWSLSSFTMDTLIAFGVGGSYGFSVVAVLVSAYCTTCQLTTYFDASVMILTFMLLGKFLEAYAKRETGDALIRLLDMSSTMATIVDEETGVETVVESYQVPKGALAKVLAGNNIPVDGIIVQGATTVDESMITGESVPQEKNVGDSVIGGTVNLTHTIRVRAERVGEGTVIANMYRIVRAAQNSKPSVQRVADQAAGIFVPIVVSYSFLVFLAWTVLGELRMYASFWRPDHQGSLSFAFSFFLATVIVACPCAMGLATPTAVMVGTGVGASRGILFKGADAIERAKSVSAVLFDKTGTLTQGKMRVVEMESLAVEDVQKKKGSSNVSDQIIDELLLAAEKESVHPIGQAVVSFLLARSADSSGHGARATVSTVENYEIEVVQVAGSGLLLRAHAKAPSAPPAAAAAIEMIIGSPSFQEKQLQIKMGSAQSAGDLIPTARIAAAQRLGRTVITVSVNGAVCRLLQIEDTLKPEARSVVQVLQKEGRHVYMVTGDNTLAAESMAARLGIPKRNIFAQQMPEDKVNVVARLQQDGHVVCFVGDGVNDSAALAKSDVSIALGAGTDVAIDSADAVLMNSKLSDTLVFFQLSAATMHRIYLNFMWAIIYNAIMLPVASGLLFPLGIRNQLPPVAAAAAMVFSSLSVLGSSLSLRCFTPKIEKYADQHRVSSSSNCDQARRNETSINIDHITDTGIQQKSQLHEPQQQQRAINYGSVEDRHQITATEK